MTHDQLRDIIEKQHLAPAVVGKLPDEDGLMMVLIDPENSSGGLVQILKDRACLLTPFEHVWLMAPKPPGQPS